MSCYKVGRSGSGAITQVDPPESPGHMALPWRTAVTYRGLNRGLGRLLSVTCDAAMDELTTPVREQHKFSVGKLQEYLVGRSRVSAGDTLTVKQYR